MTDIKFTTGYKHPLFQSRCTEYAAVGYIFLKDYLKTITDEEYIIKMKSYYLGNDGDDRYDPLHYYLEIKIGNQLIVIDNDSVWWYSYDYTQRFKPKKIKTIGIRKIKWIYEETSVLEKYLTSCIIIDLKEIILRFFDNLKLVEKIDYYKNV